VQFTASGRKPTAHALRELYASVSRFVLASYDDLGVATVIGPIAAREVPGYKPLSADALTRYAHEFEGKEDAWTVRYEPTSDTVFTVYAVWSYDENVFSLYDDGAKGGAAR